MSFPSLTITKDSLRPEGDRLDPPGFISDEDVKFTLY